MTREQALSRMVHLTRDFVARHVSDRTILEAFQNCTVRCVANADLTDVASGQSGLIAFASLVARMGVQVQLDLPTAPIRGHQPPLSGAQLVPALVNLGADLIPGTAISTGTERPDLVFLFGNVAWASAALPTWRVNASDWGAEIWRGQQRQLLPQLQPRDWPIGPLTGAALAATEVFKHVLRQLPLADDYYKRYLSPVRFARWTFGDDIEAPSSIQIGPLGVISAGAITQAALFTLFRFPRVAGSCFLFEPDTTDLSNLNRNMLSTRRDVGRPKTQAVLESAPTSFDVDAIPHRFAGSTPLRMARHVIVGVDDIPSRWIVQATQPQWLGVAGTSHFGVSCSSHIPQQACAGCLHPRDEVIDTPIPTVSFVSFWAGLSLAVRLARRAIASPYASGQQQLWLWPLRMDTAEKSWSPVSARIDCPVGCTASRNVRSSPRF